MAEKEPRIINQNTSSGAGGEKIELSVPRVGARTQWKTNYHWIKTAQVQNQLHRLENTQQQMQTTIGTIVVQ
jgi:hypothetical protein